FAATLNELRTLSAKAGNPAGLHYAFDHEGEWGDFCFGTTRHFPNPLGLYASGNPALAYEVGRAIGLQARALGANFIHSPVLDIASNPRNPEVGTRAFGPSADEVSRFAMQSFLGLTSAGIITAAKHFPGRGDSVSDAHYKLPVVTASAEEMRREHLRPYSHLIEAGLPAIMAAFSAYPSLEKDGNARRPAATSKQIITGLLREEMGFDGVITTDNCQMGGLLEIYEIGEAAVRSLQAGCDLVLFRAYTPARNRVVEAVLRAVESGEYPLADLDASVRRILRMRYDMGLDIDYGRVSVEEAAAVSRDPEIVKVETKAAECSVTVLRERQQGILVAQ
ncbi:MAG: glycoside hydrolase family 3 protein, partial [Chthoniobacterales bacterium]